jgi:hypothetical protein
MNSPVSCLPDPIQNMVKNKTKNKNKNKKRGKKAVKRKGTPFLKTVMAPTSFGTVQGGVSPFPNGVMTPTGFMVKNFELSATYTAGNGAFTVDGIHLNPGISTVFPWLYTIARNYSKFRWLFVRAMYSSSVSTATPGKAWINATYDAQDTAPTTFAQVMSSETSAAGPVWFGGAVNATKSFDPQMNGDANIFVDIDCKRFANNWYYTRNARVGGTELSSGGALTGAPTGGIGTLAFTQGTYVDEASIPCQIRYGTNGVTNGLVPGELYFSYIIEFCEPISAAITV